MNNVNQVFIEGNLTRDPQFNYTPNGAAVCKFSVAVNRSYKKGDQWEKEVSYIDVTVWGRTAEFCNEHVFKGTGVFVSGYLKQERWESDGQTRSKVAIVASEIRIIARKANEGEDQ
jgi:single-strand DNA-binding protein